MSFIKTTAPDDATGELRGLYDQDLKTLGYVANYTRAMSLRPGVIVAWRALSKAIRANVNLRRYELVTVAAAVTLRCSY